MRNICYCKSWRVTSVSKIATLVMLSQRDSTAQMQTAQALVRCPCIAAHPVALSGDQVILCARIEAAARHCNAQSATDIYSCAHDSRLQAQCADVVQWLDANKNSAAVYGPLKTVQRILALAVPAASYAAE